MNGNGYIELSELREALKTVGVDIPGYQARALEDEYKKSDRNKDGKLSLDEFEKVSLSPVAKVPNDRVLIAWFLDVPEAEE